MKPTTDEVLKWAREADTYAILQSDDTFDRKEIFEERFAALAYAAGAADMKEQCAKVCDEKVAAEYATGKVDHNEMGWTQSCAITIRALGDNDE